MKILFVHNNFPAQYRHLAAALARDPAIQIAAIAATTAPGLKGIKLLKYSVSDGNVAATHPFARRFDLDCRRAEQVLYALSSLETSGFVPDVVMVHPGWGESLPIRTIFPKARIVLYCEFFYGREGRDVGFDPEFSDTGIDGDVALNLKNATTLLALTDCDQGVSPTEWQRSTYPEQFQQKISVIHEGVDVDVVKPSATAAFDLPSGAVLTRKDEVITFVCRNLEPLRGYHIFMRSLPKILAERPDAQVLIVGGAATSYGRRPDRGASWKLQYLEEVEDRIDLTRVHFLGQLPYQDYLRVLQISSVHIYLTYPFVLSWSLLEAMSAGCLVIGSDTAPVREVIDGKNGIIVPFFDSDRIAAHAIEVLRRPSRFKSIRAQARQTIVERYDMSRICVPRMMSFLGIESKSVAPKKRKTSTAAADLP